MSVDPTPPPRDEPPIGDAELLYSDAPERQAPAAKAPREAVGPGETYDVAGPEPAPRAPFVPPSPAARTPEKTAAPRRERVTLEPSEAVEQVWSRWAEWGASLMLLAAAGIGLVVLLYFAVASEAYGLALFLLFAGGILLAVLSYPVLITLERPVRVTPEQAVSDFFGALSHHVPHYRRMWLLLSRAGRTSASFASFEGFQNYWRERLARLRGDRVSKRTPLKFTVAGFKAAKSAGKEVIDAKYTVEVYVRGRQAEGPIASYRVETTLVKGPDRMWYLDDGTLPVA